MKLRETAIVSGGLLVQQASVFATGILIARLLGASAFGTVGTLKSLSSVLVIITPLGLDIALLKHASFYHERPAELRTIARALRLIVGGLNLAILALVVVWLGPALQSIYRDIPDFSNLCIITMIGLVFAADIQISGALYRVAERVVPYSALVNYGQPLIRLVLSFVVLLAAGGIRSVTWVSSLAFAGTMAAIALYDMRHRAAAAPMAIGQIVRRVRAILSESSWMAMTLLIYSAIRLVDILILAALTTTRITGEYTAMSSVSQLISIYPIAISQTLGPRIALLYQQGDKAGIVTELRSYLRKATILGGYLLGGIAVFGTDLDLVFGRGFDFPWLLAVFLATGYYISATLAPFGYLLSMTGRHRQELVIVGVGAALLVVCLELLIPPLGAVGASLAVLIAFVAVNAVRCGSGIRVLGRNPLRWGDLVPPACFVADAAICRTLGALAIPRSLPALIVECAAYTLLAGVTFALVLADDGERRRMARLLTRRVPQGAIRLAVVAPHYPEYSLRYATAMAARCPVIACVDADQLALDAVGRPELREQPAWVHRGAFKTPLDLARMLAWVLRFKPTVLHVQEAVGPRRGFFNLALVKLLKPFALIAVTVHDPVPHLGRDLAAARRTEWSRNHVRRLADVIVVHGEFCARTYRTLGRPPGQALVVSQHGLLLEPRAQTPPPATPLKLAFFGRMEAYKGIEVLLQAVEALHDEGFAFELSIDGRGPELDRLEPRFLALPEVRISNTLVEPSRIVQAVQDAACVILPYLSATQSGVLATAYAGRRFVIASETGGLPDVVHHMRNGLLVPPGDWRALAAAIRIVGNDPELRARLCLGADETARVALDWGRIGGELMEAFATALDRLHGTHVADREAEPATARTPDRSRVGHGVVGEAT